MQQLSASEFTVVFPSKESLKMISSCTSFTLPLNKIVVSVRAVNGGGRAAGVLSETWVLFDDVPSGLCNASLMLALAELVGKPIEVDMTSLDRLGSVRVKMWCLDPARVAGSIVVFPSSTAFRILVRVEGVEAPQQPPPPPPKSPSPTPEDEGKDGSAFDEDSGEPFPSLNGRTCVIT